MDMGGSGFKQKANFGRARGRGSILAGVLRTLNSSRRLLFMRDQV